jgi:glutamyl-tRNA synthetase
MPYVEPELKAAGWWKDAYEGEDRARLLRTVDAVRERFALLGDFRKRGAAYFSDEFELEDKARANLDKDNARELLRGLGDRLDKLESFSEESVEAALRAYAAEQDVKAGLLINASRAALTGQAVGPSAFALFGLIGRERVVQRLRAC